MSDSFLPRSHRFLARWPLDAAVDRSIQTPASRFLTQQRNCVSVWKKARCQGFQLSKR